MLKTTCTKEPSVKELAKKIKADLDHKNQEKQREADIKRKNEMKKEEELVGNKLIDLFKGRFFSLSSSNHRVASLVASRDDYYVLAYDGLAFHGDNEIFRNYTRQLEKKFDIRISMSTVKPPDYYSGSGDDMVYRRNPTELRVWIKA